MKKTWRFEIDCANCAAKVEAALAKLPGVEAVSVNYVNRRLTLTAADDQFDAVTAEVAHKIGEIEPEAVLYLEAGAAKTEQHHAHGHCGHAHEHQHGEHCDCGHDHAHEHDSHNHAHEHDGHNHHHQHGEHCGCGHDHAHEHHAHEKHDDHAHHDHGHHHDHGGEANGRLLLIRVGMAVLLIVAGLLMKERFSVLSIAVFMAAYLAAGYDVLLRAFRNILRGDIFDENFLMAVASLGAMCIGEFAEGVAVMALYQVGEYFQDKAVDKSRASITALMDIRPDYANLLVGNEVRRVSPEAVHVGDVILVKPGEKMPLDGVVAEGTSSLNTTALTGESLPRDVQAGDTVLSGCVNLSGVLNVRVTAAYGESTVAKILELVESSGDAKAKTERFITKFSRVYTPAVCLAAVVLAVVPSLFDGQWTAWLYRALTFLVISCPCALVISVPLTFFSGIGGASKKGILVKGANHIETLAALDTVVLDKTGTLTKGVFTVTEVVPVGISRETLLDIVAHAECYSDHPISRSLREAWGQPVDNARVENAQEQAGHGVRALVDGRTVLAGNARMMAAHGIECTEVKAVGTVVHAAVDGVYAGYVLISDVLKRGSTAAMAALKEVGVSRLVMLTGDTEPVAADVAHRAGLTHYRAGLLPEDKVTELEALLGGDHHVAFVGDGINDAPVLRRADLGIAMGGLGADAAIEAADVVLMDDDPGKLALAMRIARRTMQIARQNITFALGVKGLVMLLGVFGFANMWLAVFADVGVAMLAILNAMRAMQTK